MLLGVLIYRIFILDLGPRTVSGGVTRNPNSPNLKKITLSEGAAETSAASQHNSNCLTAQTIMRTPPARNNKNSKKNKHNSNNNNNNNNHRDQNRRCSPAHPPPLPPPSKRIPITAADDSRHHHRVHWYTVMLLNCYTLPHYPALLSTCFRPDVAGYES